MHVWVHLTKPYAPCTYHMCIMFASTHRHTKLCQYFASSWHALHFRLPPVPTGTRSTWYRRISWRSAGKWIRCAIIKASHCVLCWWSAGSPTPVPVGSFIHRSISGGSPPLGLKYFYSKIHPKGCFGIGEGGKFAKVFTQSNGAGSKKEFFLAFSTFFWCIPPLRVCRSPLRSTSPPPPPPLDGRVGSPHLPLYCTLPAPFPISRTSPIFKSKFCLQSAIW